MYQQLYKNITIPFSDGI